MRSKKGHTDRDHINCSLHFTAALGLSKPGSSGSTETSWWQKAKHMALAPVTKHCSPCTEIELNKLESSHLKGKGSIFKQLKYERAVSYEKSQ